MGCHGEDFGGCLTIIADSDEVQELREQLYQAKQVVKGVPTGCLVS